MKPIYEEKCCGLCYWYDYKQCLCKNPGSRNFNYFAICDASCDDWETNPYRSGTIKDGERTDDEYMKGFSIGNAFKYLYRHKRKNGLEDIDKAIWYLNKYKELHGKS